MVIQTFSTGDDPDEADATEVRLGQLLALLEDVVADNPKLGGVKWSTTVRGDDLVEPDTTHGGWRGRANAVLTATAHLN